MRKRKYDEVVDAWLSAIALCCIMKTIRSSMQSIMLEYTHTHTHTHTHTLSLSLQSNKGVNEQTKNTIYTVRKEKERSAKTTEKDGKM